MRQIHLRGSKHIRLLELIHLLHPVRLQCQLFVLVAAQVLRLALVLAEALVEA
jgi:hypothetical protein